MATPPLLVTSGNDGLRFLRLDPTTGAPLGTPMRVSSNKFDDSRGLAVLPNGNIAVAENHSAYATVVDSGAGDVVGYLYIAVQKYVFGACTIMNGRLAVFCDNTANRIVMARTNYVEL